MDKELNCIISYAKENDLDDDVCRRQLRALWTAYCIHNDMLVDTASYDRILSELFALCRVTDRKTSFSFDEFDEYMCQDLI